MLVSQRPERWASYEISSGHLVCSRAAGADHCSTPAALPGVKESESYRTRDLRRGHALDLQLSGTWRTCLPCLTPLTSCCVAGAPLWEILAAGDWSSPAFMDYLDKWRLEQDVVMQAHLDESDCEDEG